jgi:hypothetical protein
MQSGPCVRNRPWRSDETATSGARSGDPGARVSRDWRPTRPAWEQVVFFHSRRARRAVFPPALADKIGLHWRKKSVGLNRSHGQSPD